MNPGLIVIRNPAPAPAPPKPQEMEILPDIKRGIDPIRFLNWVEETEAEKRREEGYQINLGNLVNSTDAGVRAPPPDISAGLCLF